MIDLKGTEMLSNVTNQTTNNPYVCIISSLSKPVLVTTSSLIMIFSLIGNILIVAAFYRNKTLRTSVHNFIANMAISDLINSVIFLPSFISRVNIDNQWLVDGVLGTCLCKLVFLTWIVSTLVSIFSMMAIAVDRFRAVLFPLKPSLITRKRCCIIIVATWIASVAFGALYLYAGRLVYYDAKLYCTFQWDPALYTWDVLIISMISIFCLSSLCAIVLSVLYSSIIIFLYRQKKRLHLASEIVKKRAKTNRKITCMLVIVVVVFYAVWIPFNVESLYYLLQPPTGLCLCASWGLTLLYPAVNPVVYYIFNEDYHQGFREILCCPWSCKNMFNNCFKSSVSAQMENTVCNAGRVNNAIENIEER